MNSSQYSSRVRQGMHAHDCKAAAEKNVHHEKYSWDNRGIERFLDFPLRCHFVLKA
jgi:hypothetical protein